MGNPFGAQRASYRMSSRAGKPPGNAPQGNARRPACGIGRGVLLIECR
jgi:hypothetical protein